MTLFMVVAYLNGESRFTPYVYGHALTTDDRCVFYVSAESTAGAAEATFTIGNRIHGDVNGKQWSSEVRSVSVGDVVKVRHMITDEETYYAVEPVGMRLLDGQRITNVKRGEHAMAEAGVAALPSKPEAEPNEDVVIKTFADIPASIRNHCLFSKQPGCYYHSRLGIHIVVLDELPKP